MRMAFLLLFKVEGLDRLRAAARGRDEDFLDRHHTHWETVEDGGRRWLLIHGYAMPSGYSERRATLALEIATSYPGAQIDMFFLQPPVALTSGPPLPNTDGRVSISGLSSGFPSIIDAPLSPPLSIVRLRRRSSPPSCFVPP